MIVAYIGFSMIYVLSLKVMESLADLIKSSPKRTALLDLVYGLLKPSSSPNCLPGNSSLLKPVPIFEAIKASASSLPSLPPGRIVGRAELAKTLHLGRIETRKVGEVKMCTLWDVLGWFAYRYVCEADVLKENREKHLEMLSELRFYIMLPQNGFPLNKVHYH